MFYCLFFIFFSCRFFCFFFFFNDTATTEIYTLSLHDALPISAAGVWPVSTSDRHLYAPRRHQPLRGAERCDRDRKSTRLNSSHVEISYAVFCLKKKKKNDNSNLLNNINNKYHNTKN